MSGPHNGAPRSYLFVPGNRPDRFGKAFAAVADAVIIDLEDAVAPQDKESARSAIAEWAISHPALAGAALVRINDDASSWFEADLDLLRAIVPAGAMLPKAESARQVARLAAALAPSTGVLALIESACGLLAVEDIAVAPRVQRLAFGTIDYAFDLGLSDDPRGLLYPGCRIALASRAAGLAPPIAGVTLALDDESTLADDMALARACGFGAKLCIHPSQVAAVHRALAPSVQQLDWARRVLAAAQAGQGAVQVDGKMVDRPVLLKAQALLAQERT